MNKQSKREINTLYESRIFDMNFRGTSNNLSSVKIFTNKNSFQIEKQISFDSEDKQISSLEYFAGSVLSSIILTLLEQSKKRGPMIEEIEGVLNLSLENPLSLVGVKGYDEEPFISKITLTVFLFVDLEDNDFDDFCVNALNNSPIYNTLKRSMELEVKFKRLV
ncbi:OsmC family protein [Bacillus sp. EB600]|uniref:OsmC family protein n=1 Tax=Bacillus sp. EB600 TaxID=2806345 RepID=UPI00210CAB24|nr:OsmC family protein [Bacillus sp. EB600]MCQ6280253.1 OsmC family protein [Bacillus sp. EB600]